MSMTIDQLTQSIADIGLMRRAEDQASQLSSQLLSPYAPGQGLTPMADLLKQLVNALDAGAQQFGPQALLAALLLAALRTGNGADSLGTQDSPLSRLLNWLLGGGASGSKAPSASPMTAGEAVQTLDSKFDKLSGGKEQFNLDDLRRAASDSSDPQLQRAAQFVLDHPNLLKGLDNADARASADSGQAADNVFSRGDIMAANARQPLGDADMAAVRTMADNKDLFFANGNLSKDQLKAIAADNWTPPSGMDPVDAARVHEAARLVMSKPALMDALDGAHLKLDKQMTGSQLDGLISKQDVDALMNHQQKSALVMA